MMRNLSASDVNTVAEFLAYEQVKILDDVHPVDCIVLCVSAIFHCAETVFSAVEARPELAKTLVICGGIGHSTTFLYDAVTKNPKYAFLHSKIMGLPEARVLEVILDNCFGVRAQQNGCKILIEDKSTNCGANAIETRKVLKTAGIDGPRTFIIVQDPTMSRRTVASFEKAYSDMENPPIFRSCPTFVPAVARMDDKLGYNIAGGRTDELWQMSRFLDLILGEVPRLRDDSNGYGPEGKGYIVHVDIPSDVEEAYARLKSIVASQR